jgi:hypothetical protein
MSNILNLQKLSQILRDSPDDSSISFECTGHSAVSVKCGTEF